MSELEKVSDERIVELIVDAHLCENGHTNSGNTEDARHCKDEVSALRELRELRKSDEALVRELVTALKNLCASHNGGINWKWPDGCTCSGCTVLREHREKLLEAK
jgi:hypothetical protein